MNAALTPRSVSARYLQSGKTCGVRVMKNIAAAVIIGGLTLPALAATPAPVTVREYPLNFEAGGASAPITLYRHQGALAFVVIDSISARSGYRIDVGSIARYGDKAGKSLPLGAYLPLRNGEAVTLQLAKDSTLKLKAHVMVVTGYGA